jgi:RimJ/RimL family protein N-acetyltransferase
VRDFGFREFGLDHVLSTIVAQNLASSRLAGKLSLQAHGQFRGFGKVHDRYELTRSRWLALTMPGTQP